MPYGERPLRSVCLIWLFGGLALECQLFSLLRFDNFSFRKGKILFEQNSKMFLYSASLTYLGTWDFYRMCSADMKMW